MFNVITAITAIIGCLLGIFNFIENHYNKIKDKKTHFKLYHKHAQVDYKIIDPREHFPKYNYDAAEEKSSLFCFSIKNNSSHPIFFNRCSFINFKRNMLFYGMEKSEVGTISSLQCQENYFKYENGKEIPVICPLKIDSNDVCVVVCKLNEKRGYYKSENYQEILQKNAKERITSYDEIEFSYSIDEKYYEEKIRASVTYYK